MADREKRRIDARRISGTFGRALSAHILLTPSRSTFAVMIARPGRPGIHDGTEFALQGFKNPVGEAAAIAFSNSSRDNLTGALANIDLGQRHD
jgi:hypothetical protein